MADKPPRKPPRLVPDPDHPGYMIPINRLSRSQREKLAAQGIVPEKYAAVPGLPKYAQPPPPPKKKVEIRRKGVVKGWLTDELCTNDFNEVGRYLRRMNRNTRVWISAFGSVYTYKKGHGRRNLRRGEKATISLIGNRALYRLGDPDIVEHMYQERKAFLMPQYADLTDEEINDLPEAAYDIEYYCVRTREPLPGV